MQLAGGSGHILELRGARAQTAALVLASRGFFLAHGCFSGMHAFFVSVGAMVKSRLAFSVSLKTCCVNWRPPATVLRHSFDLSIRSKATLNHQNHCFCRCLVFLNRSSKQEPTQTMVMVTMVFSFRLMSGSEQLPKCEAESNAEKLAVPRDVEGHRRGLARVAFLHGWICTQWFARQQDACLLQRALPGPQGGDEMRADLSRCWCRTVKQSSLALQEF